MKIYPWQHEQWQRIRAAYDSERFPHALLLSGPYGIGLGQFARTLAAALLCDAFDVDGADESDSRDWQLFLSANHPDYCLLEPEEEGKQIKVDQVRELISFMQFTSQYGRKKIGIIEPADNMNHSATNGLLKTLEEPPSDSLLILVCNQPSLLPITIRSRCQTIHFSSYNDSETLTWIESKLKKTGQKNINLEGIDQENIKLALGLTGAPLSAIEFLEADHLAERDKLLDDLTSLQQGKVDPLVVAGRWNKDGADHTVQCLQSFFLDMLRLKIMQLPPKLLNKDLSQNLRQQIKRLDLFELLGCCELLGQIRRYLNSNISYNTQGLLEEFVLHWQGLKQT